MHCCPRPPTYLIVGQAGDGGLEDLGGLGQPLEVGGLPGDHLGRGDLLPLGHGLREHGHSDSISVSPHDTVIGGWCVRVQRGREKLVNRHQSTGEITKINIAVLKEDFLALSSVSNVVWTVDQWYPKWPLLPVLPLVIHESHPSPCTHDTLFF